RSQTIGSNGASNFTESGASSGTPSPAGQTYSMSSTTARPSQSLFSKRVNARMRVASGSESRPTIAARWRSTGIDNGAYSGTSIRNISSARTGSESGASNGAASPYTFTP